MNELVKDSPEPSPSKSGSSEQNLSEQSSSRIALGVEYNGSNFNGYQLQQSGTRTVQEEIERAVSMVANEPIRVTCAGRTDSGVHATGQVVHFNTRAKRLLKAWVMGVNSNLPKDVCIHWAREVNTNFNARFSATSRSYRYVLFTRRVRSAILDGNVSWCYANLDVSKMHEAAQLLLGENDFSAFRAAQCQAKHPNRVMQSIQLKRAGAYVIMDIHANAFLHHMVRNIMGSLLVVGRGEQTVEWIGEVLDSRDRTKAGMTAPPAGLYLVNVEYPQEFGLPSSTGWLPDFG